MAGVSWLHPSRRRLARWAEEANDEKTESHVEQCARCIGIIEQRESDEGVPMGEVLRALLNAPSTLEDELVVRAEEARKNRAALEVLGGLVVVPWETLRIMIEEGRSDG
jgi:hypothetical protein